MNKQKEHLYIIPKDDADRQIAIGFIEHYAVDGLRVQVMPPAGGWSNVLGLFTDEYAPLLSNNHRSYVVLLIDFDGHVNDRKVKFEGEIPAGLKPRVFVVGSKHTPEELKKSMKKKFDEIGELLADDCDLGTTTYWDHDQLEHNAAERERLILSVRPFLFKSTKS